MDNNPERDHNHELSEKQSNTEEHKLSTAIAAVTDPKFPLPILDEKASAFRYVSSFATLVALVGIAVAGAWYLGTEMLQSKQPLVVVCYAVAGVLGTMFITGTIWIDWFELVVGYWWLSMPIGALAGLALVMNQEQSAPLQESA